MENLLNPVVIAVVLLCVLCLLKINVLLSMLVSLFVAGLVGGMGIVEIKDSLLAGLGGNGETALAYILLGTLAACMATTGITEILSKKIAKVVGGNKWAMILTLLIIACLSQNLIPIHIAYIPILVPPLLVLMNKMRLDRRGVACTIAFGHKAPYIAIPFGFGAIFMGIICDNINLNVKEDWGWDKVTMGDVTAVNWILAVAMLIGLAIALFITYRKPRDYKDVQIEGVKETGNLKLEYKHWVVLDRKPRDYKDVQIEGVKETGNLKLEYKHWVVLAALVVAVAIQIWCGSLPVAALGGLLVIFVFRDIDPKDIDAQFQEGIKLMGFIAFVMLVAGGFAQVIKDTGAVDELVKSLLKIQVQ